MVTSIPFLVRCAVLCVLFAAIVAGAAPLFSRFVRSVRASAAFVRGCPAIVCPFVAVDAQSAPVRSLSASVAHRRGSFTTRSVPVVGATGRSDDPRAASLRRFEPAIAEPVCTTGRLPSFRRSAARPRSKCPLEPDLKRPPERRTRPNNPKTV
jgi:hypothetical protein